LQGENFGPAQLITGEPEPDIRKKKNAPEKLVAPAKPEDITEEEEVAEGHGKKKRHGAEELPGEPSDERAQDDGDCVLPPETKPSTATH